MVNYGVRHIHREKVQPSKARKKLTWTDLLNGPMPIPGFCPWRSMVTHGRPEYYHADDATVEHRPGLHGALVHCSVPFTGTRLCFANMEQNFLANEFVGHGPGTVLHILGLGQVEHSGGPRLAYGNCGAYHAATPIFPTRRAFFLSRHSTSYSPRRRKRARRSRRKI